MLATRALIMRIFIALFSVDDTQRYRSCEPMSTVTTVFLSM
jgi:hypothetical protein